jgi:hypothetical protein
MGLAALEGTLGKQRMPRAERVVSPLVKLGYCALLGALAACTYQPPDDGRRVVVSDASITVVDQKASASVSIAELERIAVRTSDRGPFEDDMFWVFTTPE